MNLEELTPTLLRELVDKIVRHETVALDGKCQWIKQLMAGDSNRELGNTGQNYLRSMFAVGFQGLLILVCVAISAVLVQRIGTSGDPIRAIWICMGYTVLLCFMLFKTGLISKSIFSAH